MHLPFHVMLGMRGVGQKTLVARLRGDPIRMLSTNFQATHQLDVH